MKKDNYKNEFEQSRKEIDITEGADGKKVLSRVDLHGKTNATKSSRFSLINILLVIFTLIPISILVFVIISLNFNNDPITPKVEDNTIKFQTSKKPGNSNAALTDDERKEQEQKQKEEKKKEEEKKKQEERKKKEAEQKKKEEEKQKQEEQKRKEAEEKRLAEEKKQQEEQQQKAAEEERKKAEAEKKKEEENKQKAGSHVVQPGETLYRISVIHYGNGDGVGKIRSANGISGNEISVGQTLVIP